MTVATLVDRLKINGSLARRCLKDLEEKGQIKQIVGHSKMKIYSTFGLSCGMERCQRNDQVLTRRQQLAPLPPPSKFPTDITSTDLTGRIATWLTAVRLGLRLFGHGFVSGNGNHFAARCSIGSEVLQILRLESHQDTNKRRGSVLPGPECDQQPTVPDDVRVVGCWTSRVKFGGRRRYHRGTRIDTVQALSMPHMYDLAASSDVCLFIIHESRAIRVLFCSRPDPVAASHAAAPGVSSLQAR